MTTMRLPLAVAAAVLASMSHQPPDAVARAAREFSGCWGSGLARVRPLNRLKDRAVAPRDADVDRRVTLEAMLAPGDDERRFDATHAAEVEGLVVAVSVGGVEAVNCFARDPAARDTHIELALTPDAPRTQRVTVEVTPRWRAAMRTVGVDWSTAALRASLVGRRVRVRGWLFFDETHRDEAANTDSLDVRGPSNWRTTAWELHPVTSLTPIE
jgi:hypothetical protein